MESTDVYDVDMQMPVVQRFRMRHSMLRGRRCPATRRYEN